MRPGHPEPVFSEGRGKPALVLANRLPMSAMIPALFLTYLLLLPDWAAIMPGTQNCAPSCRPCLLWPCCLCRYLGLKFRFDNRISRYNTMYHLSSCASERKQG